MKTLIDQVVWRGKALGEIPSEETCTVMTRRIRWFIVARSRTTVLPGTDCDSTPGFIVWWNSDDPVILGRVHFAMVQIIGLTGFTEPAVWCDSRHENRNPKSLAYFWQERLGDLFCYYRKAT
jgi:hypothetical protein